MAIADEELPILNDVIRKGDKSLIRSARFKSTNACMVNTELAETPQFELPSHLKWEVQSVKREAQNPHCQSSDDIEDRIDQIIDKHIVALRKELRILLDEA